MKTIIALTHAPPLDMSAALRTFIDVEPIDLDRVHAQHVAYRNALAAAGAEVVVLDVSREHPDAIFIEDVAVVLDEVAILTSMGAAARRPEVDAIAPTLRTYRSEIVRVELPASLDGGDVLLVGKTMLVGVTTRTNDAAVAALDAIGKCFGYRAKPVRVTGCLHLKTACTALPDGTLLARTKHIALEDVEGFPVVPIGDDEPGGANVVLVGEHVVMGAAFPRTTAMIRARGFEVTTVDLTELAKAEGSATCLSILLHT